MSPLREYDLHSRGMRVDDATSELDRLISRARNGGVRVFGVVTGYGSSGGTSRIRSAVLAACRKYVRQNHIRGVLDGEHAGDARALFPSPTSAAPTRVPREELNLGLKE